MNIAGLEQIRLNSGMSMGRFAAALAAAAGQLVDKPLSEIELHEVALIYGACAAVSDQAAVDTGNALREMLGLDPIERAAA